MIATHADTDAELVARSRAGDIAAFEAIVARHRVALVATAEARLASRADAEDVAQDAFVRAFFRLDSLRDASALLPWLRRMTDRLALMQLRSRREEPLAPEALEALCADARDPVEEVAQAEDMLAALPRPMRQAVVLTGLAGYTCAETGRLLGVSEGTVKSRLHRARAKLRDLAARREEGEMATESQDGFTRRTIERLKEEARRKRAEGDLKGAERLAWAIFDEQIKAFRGGREPESMADRLEAWFEGGVEPDPEAVAMFSLTDTERRLRQFEANAAQYGFRLEELDWVPGEANRFQGTPFKPTGEGKDTWGVPVTRLQLTIVDARELCQRLRCSPVALWRWVQQGCPILRCWPWARFDVDRVRQWLAANGVSDWPREDPYMLERPIRLLFREVYDGKLSAEEFEQLTSDLGGYVWNAPRGLTGGWDDERP